MTQTILDLITATSDRELSGLKRMKRPVIKILLYTDDPGIAIQAPVGDFGLGRMINLLEAHAPAFADLSIKWESRYPSGSTHADNKIHVVLDREKRTGQPFDQIWFFGIHQVNKEKVEFGLGGGGPESELDADEVEALKAWMNAGGGVLMTGDHANLRPTDALPPDPNPPCPYLRGNDDYAGLGRALGRCVPRAGELRDWDGAPTASEEDSNNTQVAPFVRCGAPFPAQVFFQTDRIPQQLILQTFDEKGKPARGGQPHPLFFYREGCGSIQLFPDHLHEGAVVIPDSFPETVWPRNAATNIQPLPRVVAYGLDKRNGNRINLLAAYDGTAANVGRIVADSTWHHYFNVNLSGLTQPTGPGSPIDQIGQFYGNLALWLSPTARRFEMAEAMFRWLAQDPQVMEELGSPQRANTADKLRAGMASRRFLSRVASPCEIHELLQMTLPREYRYVEPFETLYLPERGYNLTSLPSEDLLIGSIVKRYPRGLLEDKGAALVSAERNEKVRAAFEDGANEAFLEQQLKVMATAVFAQKFLATALVTSSSLSAKETGRDVKASFSVRQSSERSNDMSVCEIPNWSMTLTKFASPSENRFSFLDIEVRDGILTGRVFDPVTGDETPLSGSCGPVEGTTQPLDLTLMRFQFTVLGSSGTPVRVFLAGHGYKADHTLAGIFIGGYFAIAVSAEEARGIRLSLAVDPGDTGTGNGNQT